MRIGWYYPWTFADRVHNHVVVSLGNDANEAVLVPDDEKIRHPDRSCFAGIFHSRAGTDPLHKSSHDFFDFYASASQ